MNIIFLFSQRGLSLMRNVENGMTKECKALIPLHFFLTVAFSWFELLVEFDIFENLVKLHLLHPDDLASRDW